MSVVRSGRAFYGQPIGILTLTRMVFQAVSPPAAPAAV
jgi:hypothetical protein